MKPTPPGWPRISTAIYYDDAAAAIDWLCRAFGFEVQIKVMDDSGHVKHSELVLGGGLIMVSGVEGRSGKYAYMKTPSQLGGGNTQNMMVYVDDIEAHAKRAREAGAKIVGEIETHDYGDDYWSDKSYECVDVGGHHWWFAERIRTGGKPA